MTRTHSKRTTAARTYGLTHLALAVRDPEASARFYGQVLGARVTYQDAASVEIQTPGNHDAIVFEREPARAGRRAGLEHFGFRLRRRKDIEVAVQAIKAAGGRIKSQGEFEPGEPYVFFYDPDGYEVELWYQSARAE